MVSGAVEVEVLLTLDCAPMHAAAWSSPLRHAPSAAHAVSPRYDTPNTATLPSHLGHAWSQGQGQVFAGVLLTQQALPVFVAPWLLSRPSNGRRAIFAFVLDGHEFP